MPRKAIAESAAKFDRIRRAHQSEVAEDYVEMIADLIAETGEARTVDLAARFGVTSPTVNAIIQRLQREDLVETRPYRSIFLTEEDKRLLKKRVTGIALFAIFWWRLVFLKRLPRKMPRESNIMSVPKPWRCLPKSPTKTSCQDWPPRLAAKIGVPAIQCLYEYKDRGFYCG
jgi:hypothetical protein